MRLAAASLFLPCLGLVLLACSPEEAEAPDATEASMGDPCARGEAALNNNDAETAAAALELCLDSRTLDPRSEAMVHAQLGGAYLYMEEYEAALRAFDLAYAVAETQGSEITNPYTMRNRGIARAMLDRHAGALRDLEGAANLIPDDLLTRLHLGGVYQSLDRPAEALAEYDAVTRIEPSWPGGWINRSGAFLDLDQIDRAVDDARRAVELEPDSGFSLNALCWSLIKADRAEAALPLCDQAVEAEPDVGAIVHSRAAALEALGRIEEARPLYARAFELEPEDEEIGEDYRRTRADR